VQADQMNDLIETMPEKLKTISFHVQTHPPIQFCVIHSFLFVLWLNPILLSILSSFHPTISFHNFLLKSDYKLSVVDSLSSSGSGEAIV
jgi:hypothetical protein